MNISKAQVEARVAGLNRLITEGRPINDAVALFGVPRNNIRDFMRRHKMEMPKHWVPRPHKVNRTQHNPNEPFLAAQRLPADRLTDDELDAAYRFGIHPERMAWLLTCEYSGTAHGLTCTRLIKTQ
jgi:hypothetical protein